MINKNSVIVTIVLFCIIVVLSVTIITIHDLSIVMDANKDAKVQYFIEYDDNMTRQEEYELIQSVCYCTFTNESLHDDLWVQRDTDGLVKQCVTELIEHRYNY